MATNLVEVYSEPCDIVIIAPHIDDELIGCFSVLRNAVQVGDSVTVVYCEELTAERVMEAKACAKHFNFEPVFLLRGSKYMPQAGEVYVPSRSDWHAAHKKISARYRQYATHFYSVDMVNGHKLDIATEKLEALNLLYPSQKALWETNAKYWLFEAITEADYQEYTEWKYDAHIGGKVHVTVLTKYHSEIRQRLDIGINHEYTTLDQIFAAVAEIAIEGTITVQQDSRILKG